ncbi:MAG: HPr family phosphocarrier protein [Lachnospiraceae bacterium]|nr:HPr family phosphocarrier protein [Lachnospiraceae bacterium]
MKSFSYTIKDALGIHARPAGLVVSEAKKFASTITIEANGKKAAATKLMAIMAMGVKQGQTVTVTADGADEAAACDAMKAFFEANL